VTDRLTTYDRNSWIETKQSLELQKNMQAGEVLFESRARDTYRKYMDQMMDKTIVELDGVGGAVLLVRAEAHRRGLIFPPIRESAEV
jgi:hypothetical protein